MDQPSPSSQKPADTVLKFWRIAFKLSFEHYSFSKFDEVKLPRSQGALFEPDVFAHNTFYDLCRIKGKYTRYHPDFEQTYFLELFSDTEYPCNVFVFIEEVSMQNGEFVAAPHQLTINHRAAKRNEQILGKRSSKSSSNSKIDETLPDFEMFYVETSNLQLSAHAPVGQCLALTSSFMRGSPLLNGRALIKPRAFACYVDAQGMTVFKYTGYRGIVPQLKNSTTLLPMILMLGFSLGLKQSLVRVNRALIVYLSNRLNAETGLNWRPGKYSKIFNTLYRKIQIFATRSYLSNLIDYKNPICSDLFNEFSNIFGLQQDYTKLQEQLKIINQLAHQMETKLLLKSQRHIRTAIFLLGLSIVISAGVVSTLLGIEPMIRLLVDLGILSPDMLNIIHPSVN